MPIPEYVKRMRASIGTDLLVMVGAAAIVMDDEGRVLLQLRSDTHTWGPPGGGVEPGEEPVEAVVREVLEETGLHVVPERLVGVYGGPEMLFSYPNGDRVAITSVTFACRVVGGALRVDDDESLDLRWFAFDDLPENMPAWLRQRVVHAFARREPYFHSPEPLLPPDSSQGADQAVHAEKRTAPAYVRGMRAHIGNELLVLVGTAAVIRNERGEVLLQLRSDTRSWGLPGGFLEPGEEPAETVVREVLEETGLVVRATRLVGVYGGPRMVYTYPNGDRVADTAFVFACEVVAGADAIGDDESLALRWFAPGAIPVGAVSRVRRWVADALTLELPYYFVPEALRQE